MIIHMDIVVKYICYCFPVGMLIGSFSLGTPQSGAIVLTRNGTNSKSHTSGRVVVYGVGSSTSSSRFWGNICRYSSFSITEADVICHQLTYSGASSWSYAEQDMLVHKPLVITRSLMLSLIVGLVLTIDQLYLMMYRVLIVNIKCCFNVL